MATRQDIITGLLNLDTATLERLLKYADTIIVPDPESLIKVTFTDMLDKAHALADIHFPEWTDRSKADFGEFIVELFCLFSEKDFYYANKFAGESFLHSATQYTSVYFHALRNGYVPYRDLSSDAKFSLVFTTGASDVVIEEGTIQLELADGTTYTNPKLTIPAGNSNYTMVRTFYSGKFVSTIAEFNGRSIRFVANRPDFTSFSIEQNGNIWTRVDSFKNSDSNSLHFMVLPTDGKEVEIIFGQDGYGLRPATGSSMNVKYRENKGSVINSAKQSLTIKRNTLNSLLVSATMETDAGRGSLAEPIESIRQNASRVITTFSENSVIRTWKDAIIILEKFPDVRKATAYNFANNLYFTVIPESGLAATPAFLEELKTRLKPIVLDGFDLNPLETVYTTLSEVTLISYLQDDFDPLDAEQQIKNYFEYITDPMEGALYEVGLDLGQATENLKSQIAGLQNVEYVTVNGTTPANVSLIPVGIFNKVNPANIHVTVKLVQ